MKKITFFLLIIWVNLFSQTKDVSKLNSKQKKQELIETLEWLKSKSGKDFYFGCYSFGKKVYNLISYNPLQPTEITITHFYYETDELISTYSFDLKDIYEPRWGTDGRCTFYNLATYENQRIIKLSEDSKNFITTNVNFYYDNAVSDERMKKALNYAIKLSNGGKKIINEKF
jgi:hypothetical protein